MAILHGRDLLSAKYITAEIKDASKRLWYVPIKRTIGDYFLADLEGQIYCFKMDTELCQYQGKLAKSFRVYQYDTSHYRPIKSEVKELEKVLKVNDLPKVNGMMADIFRWFGDKEKKDFNPHTLKDLVEKIGDDQGKKNGIKKDPRYAEQAESVINFLDNLNIEQIATPVRKVSDFIEDDLRATDAKFLGTVATTLQNLDYENKKVTNTPVKPTLAWAKWGLAIMMVVMVGFAIYWMYDQGWFDSFLDIGKSFEGISVIPTPGQFSPPTAKDDAYYQKNYTPESLRAAIDRGEIDENTLPPMTKEMVKNVKAPVVETP